MHAAGKEQEVGPRHAFRSPKLSQSLTGAQPTPGADIGRRPRRILKPEKRCTFHFYVMMLQVFLFWIAMKSRPPPEDCQAGPRFLAARLGPPPAHGSYSPPSGADARRRLELSTYFFLYPWPAYQRDMDDAPPFYLVDIFMTAT